MEAGILESHLVGSDVPRDEKTPESLQLDLTKDDLSFDGLCPESIALARIISRTVSSIQLLRVADDIAEIEIRVSKQGLFPSTIARQIALGETQKLPYGGTLYLERLDTTPKSMSARLRFTADA